MRKRNDWRCSCRHVAAVMLTLLLAACGSTPRLPSSAAPVASSSKLPPAGSGRGGYYQDDGPGDHPPDGLENVPDAVPRVEPYASGSNKPYTVLGKTYTPFTDNRPFKQRGIGSWYGKKFHGQKTSSGELYDMYKMTAAHPTLPIPSYARVTNLRNGKQVIVRINDRGPFLSSRIIDLSYTAALRLGYVGAGSSELEVERILPEDIKTLAYRKQSPEAKVPETKSAEIKAPEMPLPPPAETEATIESVIMPTVETGVMRTAALPAAVSTQIASAQPAPASVPVSMNVPPPAETPVPSGFYLQFGAFGKQDNAAAARDSWQKKWSINLPPIEVKESDALYRLSSGPFASRVDAEAAARQAKEAGLPEPVILQR